MKKPTAKSSKSATKPSSKANGLRTLSEHDLESVIGGGDSTDVFGRTLSPAPDVFGRTL